MESSADEHDEMLNILVTLGLEDVWPNFKSNKVGPKEVESLGAEEFKFLGINAIGDRIRIKNACRNYLKGEGNCQSPVVQRFLDINSRRRTPKKARVDKKTVLVHIGWKHSKNNSSYKLVTASKGGGKQSLEVDKATSLDELYQQILNLYFPGGESQAMMLKLPDIKSYLATFTGEEIGASINDGLFTVGEYYRTRKTTPVRIYLHSIKVESTAQNTAVDGVIQKIDEKSDGSDDDFYELGTPTVLFNRRRHHNHIHSVRNRQVQHIRETHSLTNSSQNTPGTSTQVTTPGTSTPIITPGTSTQVPTPGTSTQVTTPGTSTQIIAPGTFTQVTTPGTSTQVTTPGTSTQIIAPGTSTQVTTPGTSTQVTTPGISTPIITPGTSTPIITPGTSTPIITPGTSTPITTPGTSTPITTPGTSTLIITPGTSTQQLIHLQCDAASDTGSVETECLEAGYDLTSDNDVDLQQALKESIIPKATFVEMLRKWRDLTVTENEPLLLLIHRQNLVESTRRAMTRQGFNFITPVKINFTGEDGEDYGGLSREYFSLLMRGLKECIIENGTFQHDVKKLERKEYFFVGRCITWSLLHGGPGFPFFKTGVVQMILNEECFILEIDSAPYEERMMLEKLQEKDTIDDSMTEWLIDHGISPPFKIENKMEIINLCLKQILFYRIHAELCQFKEGLDSFNFLNSLREYPKELGSLFCDEYKQISFEEAKKMVEVHYRDEGSNDRRGELDTTYAFETFIQDCTDGMLEVSFEDVLSFWTGARTVPPLGFEKKLEIHFINGKEKLPVAHTCEMSLELPRGLMPDDFKKKMVMAIQWGGEFHLV